MEVKTVKELNAVLKGEQMAVDAYNRFIDDTGDAAIRQELQRIKQDHERHAGEIADRIRSLGGEPEHNTGFAGFIASAKMTMQSIGDDDMDVLQKAYEGEDKGIAAVEELVKGDLDRESLSLVQSILSEDHGHLRNMAKLIGQLENPH